MKNTTIMSRFNVLFERDRHYYITNTLHGGLHEIDEHTYNLCSLVQQYSHKITELSEDLLTTLHKFGYLVKADADNDAILQLRYLKMLKSFQSHRLTLVIAPTLYCNFACPYCYEKDIPYSTMQDGVIDDLLTFIKSYEQRFKYLELCWHGGEPLVAISVINRLLQRIKTETSFEQFSHSMVSNGLLLDTRVEACFAQHPLSYVQITIDGNETIHNLNRICKTGEPTFNKILENIDWFTQRFPNTNVGVRMNIHKDNVQEFVPMYQRLTERWAGRCVQVYPAFVMNNQSCRVPCFNSIEKTQFLYELYTKIGRRYSDVDMKLKTGNCTAIYENSYVVDPNGDLFKCWVDVGKHSTRIGTLKDGVSNHALAAKYILGSDKFSDQKCLSCSVFPICSGGCNKYRLDTEYATHDICPISAESIVKFMNF